MKKIGQFSVIVLLLCTLLPAVLEHSPAVVINYKKYLDLTRKYPENTRYHFELAMVLARMGKIETAGEEFKKIDELDSEYAPKILNLLEKTDATTPSLENDFKLGFCYYFLFEEATGRMELADRRIVRSKKSGDQEKIKRETAIKKELAPKAADLKEKALYRFKKISKKEPQDNFNAWGYTYMAVIRAIEKNWSEALRLCEKAVKIEPEAYAIRAAYMEALRQNGKGLAATGQFSKAYQLKSAQEKYERKLFGDAYYIE